MPAQQQYTSCFQASSAQYSWAATFNGCYKKQTSLSNSAQAVILEEKNFKKLFSRFYHKSNRSKQGKKKKKKLHLFQLWELQWDLSNFFKHHKTPVSIWQHFRPTSVPLCYWFILALTVKTCSFKCLVSHIASSEFRKLATRGHLWALPQGTASYDYEWDRNSWLVLPSCVEVWPNINYRGFGVQLQEGLRFKCTTEAFKALTSQTHTHKMRWGCKWVNQTAVLSLT